MEVDILEWVEKATTDEKNLVRQVLLSPELLGVVKTIGNINEKRLDQLLFGPQEDDGSEVVEKFKSLLAKDYPLNKETHGVDGVAYNFQIVRHSIFPTYMWLDIKFNIKVWAPDGSENVRLSKEPIWYYFLKEKRIVEQHVDTMFKSYVSKAHLDVSFKTYLGDNDTFIKFDKNMFEQSGKNEVANRTWESLILFVTSKEKHMGSSAKSLMAVFKRMQKWKSTGFNRLTNMIVLQKMGAAPVVLIQKGSEFTVVTDKKEIDRTLLMLRLTRQ